MFRRLEYRGSASGKFWEVTVEGSTYTVRFGKLGRDGQARATACADPAVARREALKKLRAKLKKGYEEVELSANAARPQASPKTASKPTARKQLDKAVGYLKQWNSFFPTAKVPAKRLEEFVLDSDTSDDDGLYRDALVSWTPAQTRAAFDDEGRQVRPLTIAWRGDRAAVQVAFARAQLLIEVPETNARPCVLEPGNPDTKLKALMRAFDGLKKKRVPAYGNLALTQSGGWESIHDRCDRMRLVPPRGIFWTNQSHGCFDARGNLHHDLALYWTGDADLLCDALDAEGLQVQRPASDREAIVVPPH